ncbi:MAG: nicotinate (nicotinamide) nucleotide adenylyltransferase [Ginsengibacter sp.]
MKIGLFFGSFNPIHVGHLIIANYIVSLGDLNEIWFVISPQNPFKAKRDLLNEYHRQFLLQSAIEGENKLKCCTIEFHLAKPSYTIDTLTYLHEKYKDHSFSIIIGSDSFKNINKWKNSKMLLKNYAIIIYKRPGFEIMNYLPTNVKILDAPLLNISSTGIRERIRNGQSIRFFVPDVVNEEIMRNHYYKKIPVLKIHPNNKHPKTI